MRLKANGCSKFPARDLEFIVAKHPARRGKGNPASVKIKNRSYSQLIGRDELFEKRYEENGAREIGWEVCARAAAAL